MVLHVKHGKTGSSSICLLLFLSEHKDQPDNKSEHKTTFQTGAAGLKRIGPRFMTCSTFCIQAKNAHRCIKMKNYHGLIVLQELW